MHDTGQQLALNRGDICFCFAGRVSPVNSAGTDEVKPRRAISARPVGYVEDMLGSFIVLGIISGHVE